MATSNFKLRPAVIAIEPITAATGVQLTTSITATQGEAGDANPTITLSNVSSLPEKGIIQIEDEEILYMTKNDSANTISNCIRGFRGTTAAAHDGSTTPLDVTHLFDIMGKTQGGITFTVSESKQALHTDQDGETPVDESITGTSATVEANLAEITLENIAFAHKTEVYGTTGSRRVEIKPNVGQSLLAVAKKVLIIPYAGATVSNDVEELITLPKAGIAAVEELQFDNSTQQVLRIQFNGYPDTNGNIAVFGKEA